MHENNDVKVKILAILSLIKKWMTNRNLKLNDGKTEIVIFRGNIREGYVGNFDALSFGGSQLLLSEAVWNLGVLFDPTLKL